MYAKVKGITKKIVSQNRKTISLFGTIGDYVHEIDWEYIPHFYGKDVQNKT